MVKNTTIRVVQLNIRAELSGILRFPLWAFRYLFGLTNKQNIHGSIRAVTFAMSTERGGVLELVQLIGNLWEALFREDQDMTAQNMKKRFQT